MSLRVCVFARFQCSVRLLCKSINVNCKFVINKKVTSTFLQTRNEFMTGVFNIIGMVKLAERGWF